MGRLSQIIAFINADKAPTDREMQFHYTSISKTPELMKARREHQKWLKAQKNIATKDKK
jgi:hypothetical protein